VIECVYKCFLYAARTKEVHLNREMRRNKTSEKILAQTGNGDWTNVGKQLCIMFTTHKVYMTLSLPKPINNQQMKKYSLQVKKTIHLKPCSMQSMHVCGSWWRGIVVIASAFRTDDPGFDSRQGVRFF
jgi:hypothetical protein